MKNIEKFRCEIVEAVKENNDENGKMCCFLNDNVIPRFISEEDVELSICGGLDCNTCAKMFAFWLEEEYIEPPKPEVDWDNVPVDTLVRVRDSLNEDWKLAFFKGFYPLKEFKFETWTNADKSKTGYDCERWMLCELVEDEKAARHE